MKPKITVLLTKYLACTLGAAVLVLAGSGCTINLQHGKLNPTSRAYTDSINLSKAATGSEHQRKGADGTVGWGRATLFAIPLIPVHVVGNGNEEVMKEIQDALTQVGYHVQDVDNGAPVSGKVLVCRVDKFRFSNYTWLFPIVPTWGRITLQTSLLGPDRHVLWSHQFTGSGMTLNFFDGYTSSAKSSMTKILNQMIKAFSSDEFHKALTT